MCLGVWHCCQTELPVCAPRVPADDFPGGGFIVRASGVSQTQVIDVDSGGNIATSRGGNIAIYYLPGSLSEYAPLSLINNLKAFNRKERFILLHKAIGFSDQSFRLGDAFRTELSESLGIVEIPSDALVVMDYHLDWLQMAMYLTANPQPSGLIPNPAKDLVKGTQQDIDLLVAFELKRKTHVILVEAKGDTAWSNKQMSLKTDRLKHIFAEGRPGRDAVEPHFVIMSPKESKNENFKATLDGMNLSGNGPVWLPLPLPNGLVKATRCDRSGADNASGDRIRLDCVSPTWLG